MFISKKKKTHIYRTFTARARTCGRAVDLPHVRLCRAASLKYVTVGNILTKDRTLCINLNRWCSCIFKYTPLRHPFLCIPPTSRFIWCYKSLTLLFSKLTPSSPCIRYNESSVWYLQEIWGSQSVCCKKLSMEWDGYKEKYFFVLIESHFISHPEHGLHSSCLFSLHTRQDLVLLVQPSDRNNQLSRMSLHSAILGKRLYWSPFLQSMGLSYF